MIQQRIYNHLAWVVFKIILPQSKKTKLNSIFYNNDLLKMIQKSIVVLTLETTIELYLQQTQ